MPIDFDEELIRVEYVIGEDTISETITGEIDVPAPKPDVERIIDVTAEVSNVVTEIEDGGVNIIGEIEPAIIYVAETEEGDQPVHFIGDEEDDNGININLTNFVDIPDAEAGMNVFTDINIKRVSFNLIDERTIELTVVLTKFVKVTEYRQITIITDVTDVPEEDIDEQMLRIEDVIGEETVTTTISGRIPLPEEKPLIERVINATADIPEPTTEIEDDSVIVDGDIEVGVIYVAETAEGDQPVHFLDGTINLMEALNIPGASEEMSVYTNLNVRRVSFNLLEAVNDEPQRVEVDVTVEIFAKVTEPRQVTVITDIVSDEVEVERELLRVEDVIGEMTQTETFSEDLVVPNDKPDVGRVIEAEARVLDYEEILERDGVIIEGEIELGIIYVADEEDQPVHFAENTYNLDNFVDVSGAEENMNVHSEVSVQRVNFDVLNVRTVEVTAVLRKFVKVTDFIQMEIITDLVVVSPVVEDECPPSYVVYVIQKGDTLWKIARRYNTTVDAIREANPDIDPQNLQVGQKICVPEEIIEPKG